MAAPAYNTDLATVNLAETTTGWAALGGGGAGLSASPDIAMEGTNCVDKQITNAEKGQVFDNGSAITNGANNHFFIWIAMTTPGLLDSYINRGLSAVIGSSTTAYVQFHLTGSDEFKFAQAFKCWPIRYVNTTQTSRPRRTLTGSPTTSPVVVGAIAKTIQTVKGANLGVDGLRRGTGYYITAGDSGTPATFVGLAAIDLASRYGILQSIAGGFSLQGRMVVGQTTGGTPTLAYFASSGKSLVLEDTEHSLTDFTQIIVDHASTTFLLTDATIATAGDTVSLDHDPYDSPDAIITQDNSASNITGQITAGTIAFDFDYTNNAQGGRTPNSPADVVVIAQCIPGARWNDAYFTITAATGLNFPVNVPDELVYSNP